jgi:16S rRNA (guanine527-N7)-methyltransferase
MNRSLEMTMTSDLEMSLDHLPILASRLGVALTPRQSEQVKDFCKLLSEWNEQINLVSNATFEVVLQDHILDSLSLVPSISTAKTKLIDIGCGAGFPGLILAIAVPNLHVTLVEATSKKTRFLESAVAQLELVERVTILNARAESLAHLPHLRYHYDLVTCRALGDLELVLELTLPFLKPNGLALLQRSVSQYHQEEKMARKNAAKLGAQLKEALFPETAILGKDRAILVFEQVTRSPSKYPRPWQKLKKKNP